jgi:hypothetical protein
LNSANASEGKCKKGGWGEGGQQRGDDARILKVGLDGFNLNGEADVLGDDERKEGERSRDKEWMHCEKGLKGKRMDCAAAFWLAGKGEAFGDCSCLSSLL